MKRLILLFALTASLSSTAARAQDCQSLWLDCPQSVGFDEVFVVTVRIENCVGTIDAFGFDIQFDPNDLEFVDVVTSATLVQSWVTAGGSQINQNTIRIGAFDLTGFGVESQAALIRFRMHVVATTPRATGMDFLPLSLTDDLSGFTATGCAVPVPVEETTWGAVKALFR